MVHLFNAHSHKLGNEGRDAFSGILGLQHFIFTDHFSDCRNFSLVIFFLYNRILINFNIILRVNNVKDSKFLLQFLYVLRKPKLLVLKHYPSYQENSLKLRIH